MSPGIELEVARSADQRFTHWTTGAPQEGSDFCSKTKPTYFWRYSIQVLKIGIGVFSDYDRALLTPNTNNELPHLDQRCLQIVPFHFLHFKW